MAPLKGELSAQLTEGFRLGLRPSLAAGELMNFLRKRAKIPLSVAAFRHEKPEPLSLGYAGPAPLSGEP